MMYQLKALKGCRVPLRGPRRITKGLRLKCLNGPAVRWECLLRFLIRIYHLKVFKGREGAGSRFAVPGE